MLLKKYYHLTWGVMELLQKDVAASSLRDAKVAIKTPTLKSVEKAFDVLACYTHDTPDFSMNELAQKLGVSKGSIHRILITAQKKGFIEKNDQTKRYQLGTKLFELGSIVMSRTNLSTESLPFLRNLTSKTGETSYVIIRDQDEALCIQSVEGHNYLRVLFLEVGKKMPLYIGAGPKIILSNLDDTEIAEWFNRNPNRVKWTEHTVTDQELIWQDIMRIRKRGYAESIEDVTDGVTSVGAPIRDAQGKVIAAVSIGGDSINFSDNKIENRVKMVIDTGLQISKRMGFSGKI